MDIFGDIVYILAKNERTILAMSYRNVPFMMLLLKTVAKNSIIYIIILPFFSKKKEQRELRLVLGKKLRI